MGSRAQMTKPQQQTAFAGKGYNYGIPTRTAIMFVLCVALGCLVWRVYGEGEIEAQNFQKNVLSVNRNENREYVEYVEYGDEKGTVERENGKVVEDVDAFDGKAEPAEDYEGIEPYEFREESTTDGTTADPADEAQGEDEVRDLYEDGAYQQNMFNWVEANKPQNTQTEDQKPVEEVAVENMNAEERQQQEKIEDAKSAQNPHATLYDEAQANREDVEGIYYPHFYPEDQNEKKGDEKPQTIEDEYVGYYADAPTEAGSSEGSEGSSSGDEDNGEDVIFVADQGDEEIARAFPDLVGAPSKPKSGSESEAVVDEYFPGYDQYAYAYDKNGQATKDGVPINPDQQNEQQQQETPKRDDEVEQAAEAEAEGYGDVYNMLFDPLQSALRFKERMDALYTAQIEALNYRNYIFDGSQFVAQLRQSLLGELSRFREGWDSLSSLPLVESPPSVDVREGSEEITLDVALPGTLRKFIRLELQNGQLILSGTRQRSCPQNSDNYSVVTFFHSFPVPRGVRSDDIRAQFEDENQTIHIKIRKPAASRPDPNHIPIE